MQFICKIMLYLTSVHLKTGEVLSIEVGKCGGVNFGGYKQHYKSSMCGRTTSILLYMYNYIDRYDVSSSEVITTQHT